jgi:hypothetical protein
VDRYSTNAEWPATDWPFILAFGRQEGQADLSSVEQIGAFASSFDRSLWGYNGYSSSWWTLCTPIVTESWTHVSIELDRIGATFRTTAHTLPGGRFLADRVDPLPGSNFQDAAAFDIVMILEGELSETKVSNLALVDNIMVEVLPEPTTPLANAFALAALVLLRRARLPRSPPGLHSLLP